MKTQNTTVHPADAELNAFVDGALPAPASRRIRRHLAHCPACAAEADALRRLAEGARGLYADVPVPASLLPVPPRPHRRRPAVLAGALVGAAVASLAAVGVWNAPGMPGRPRVAFADVERAMGQVRSARWIETHIKYDESGRPLYEYKVEVTARVDPPAMLRRPVRGTIRSFQEGTSVFPSINSITPGKTVTYMSDRRQWIVCRSPSDEDPTRAAAQLRSWIRANILSPAPDEFRTARPQTPTSDRSEAFREVSEVTRDGRRLLEFRSWVPRQERLVQPPGQTHTVWADPYTKRIARSESVMTGYRSDLPHRRTVAEEFRYNLPLNDADFDLPPAGAKKVVYRQQTTRRTREAWAGMSPAERGRLRATLMRSFDAFARDDYSDFAAEWDFSYLDRFTGAEHMGTAQRRDWKIRMGNGRRYRAYPIRDLSLEVFRAYSTDAITPARSLPPGEPPLLSVSVVASFTADKDGRKREVKQHYLLRRTAGGGYKVLKWSDWDWWNHEPIL